MDTYLDIGIFGKLFQIKLIAMLIEDFQYFPLSLFRLLPDRLLRDLGVDHLILVEIIGHVDLVLRIGMSLLN